MKLNGISCGGFTMPMKDVVEFSLSGTTIEAVGALDGQDLILTEDDGTTTVGSFKGYAVTAVYQSNGAVRMRAARELDADSKSAIENLETSVTLLTTKATAIEGDVSDVEEANADVLQAIGELGVDIAGIQSTNADLLQAVGELGTMIASMSAPADDVTE